MKDQTSQLEVILRLQAGRLLHGFAADVAKYATAMAADLAAARLVGDEVAIRHLAAQAKLLAAKHKLTARKEAWQSLSNLVLELGNASADAIEQAANDIAPENPAQ